MAKGIIKHIPNSITCLNLLSGALAVINAVQGNTDKAILFILCGAVFDFLDGMAARALHSYSDIGKELDSLADVITFGLAPSMLCFNFLKFFDYGNETAARYVPYIGLIIAIFSGLRLAKFNIDTRQTTSFLGLPVPANALFWCGICHNGVYYGANQWWVAVIYIAVIVGTALLLVSSLPMFSLKFHNLTWKENKIRFIFLIICIPLTVVLKVNSLSYIILLYILLSLAQNLQKD